MGTHYAGTARERRALDAFIKLMRATQTVSGTLYRELERRDGLTQSQLGVLEALLHLGPMTAGEVAAKVFTSRKNLTTVLANLERDGLIRRAPLADDRRASRIELTPAGRARIRAVFPRHVARVVRLMATLGAAEQEQLATLCKKLGLGASKLS